MARPKLNKPKVELRTVAVMMPVELHYRFKLECTKLGESMNEVLVDFIEGYVGSFEGENRFREVRLKKLRLTQREFEEYERKVKEMSEAEFEILEQMAKERKERDEVKS